MQISTMNDAGTALHCACCFDLCSVLVSVYTFLLYLEDTQPKLPLYLTRYQRTPRSSFSE